MTNENFAIMKHMPSLLIFACAVLAAVSAYLVLKPSKVAQVKKNDMIVTGKGFAVGVDENGGNFNINAYRDTAVVTSDTMPNLIIETGSTPLPR